MENDTKILKLLISSRKQSFTIRGIASILKLNYRTAHERISALEKEGLVKVKKIGCSKLCTFANRFNGKVYEAELSRRLDLFRNKDFLVIRERLACLNFTFIALLFGSHAKGEAGKHSDIDLLTIGGNEPEIKSAVRLLPFSIHLTSVSCGDFIAMARRKDFSVVAEALNNNIILIGIEEYYRMLSNSWNVSG